MDENYLDENELFDFIIAVEEVSNQGNGSIPPDELVL